MSENKTSIKDPLEESISKLKKSVKDKHYTPPKDNTDKFRDEELVDRDASHIDMLNFVLESSKKLSIAIDKSEDAKTKWRDRFMKILIVLLILSLIFAGTMTLLYGFRLVEFPMEVVVGLFGTIIVQLVSILVLFVKFVNDVQYIKMFKTVTHKLLEYLTKVHPGKKNDDTSSE